MSLTVAERARAPIAPYFRTTDVTGRVELPDGAEMVLPGDSAEFTVELHQPVALTEHARFARVTRRLAPAW